MKAKELIEILKPFVDSGQNPELIFCRRPTNDSEIETKLRCFDGENQVLIVTYW